MSILHLKCALLHESIEMTDVVQWRRLWIRNFVRGHCAAIDQARP